MAARQHMKLRYPAGVPLDDLEVGQQYRLTCRVTGVVIAGELRDLVLRRRKPPSLTLLPTGQSHCVSFGIHKLSEIAVAELDLSNSDYRDEDGDNSSDSDDTDLCGGC